MAEVLTPMRRQILEFIITCQRERNFPPTIREIGDHTVVAARSVVKGVLPPRVLATGNPAVVVRQLEIPDGWRRG